MKQGFIKFTRQFAALTLFTMGASFSMLASSQIGEALKSGTVSGNFNLRYESVDQENSLNNADGLTLRSRLNYTSGSMNGFSGVIEFEDVRIVAGLDNYSVGPTGFKPGQYSVIADPETTELDQGYVQYANDKATVKIGRQLAVYDNQRFIGHVGWRQDRQTFDALTLDYKLTENLELSYNYINQRNRIFAEAADIDSKDQLFHGSYKTSLGTVSAYAYLLETDMEATNSLDTFGLRFAGGRELGGFETTYLAEYAIQDYDDGISTFDAEYYLLEAGVALSNVNVKLGYEQMGSDNASYGFSTPLATLHAHNGWADLFLTTPAEGLTDLYLSLGGKIVDGNWSVIYHKFDADKSTALVKDLGSELDFQLSYPFSSVYNMGIKYAAYFNADDVAAKPDTNKLWVWLNVSF